MVLIGFILFGSSVAWIGACATRSAVFKDLILGKDPVEVLAERELPAFTFGQKLAMK
jgi:hypothetical protein